MVVYYDLLRFNTRLKGYVIYVVCKVIDVTAMLLIDTAHVFLWCFLNWFLVLIASML